MGSRSIVGMLLLFGLSACGDSTQQNNAPAVEVDSQSTVTAAPEVHPGEEVYENFCFSCHTPGLSGAPKLGDVDAWAPRIAKGPDLLLTTTKEGIPPAMPAMG